MNTLALALLCLPTLTAPQSQRLSHTLGATLVQGSVDSLRLSPDGQWVVYLADERLPGVVELFSARRDGTGNPTRLHPDLPASAGIAEFVVDPTGQRVLFRVDDVTDGTYELYSVPVGGGVRTRLNLPSATNGGVSGGSPYGFTFRATPDGQRVVYANDAAPGSIRLFSAPLDGSAAAVPLFALPAGPLELRETIHLTLDGQSVLLLADLATTGLLEVFRVPVDASGPPVVLTPPLGPGRDVTAFVVTPDDSRLVFSGNVLVGGRFDLFSRPLDLSTPAVQINGPMVAGGNVFVGYRISNDSSHVLYEADQITDGVEEYFCVPVDGSQLPFRVNLPLGPSESLAAWISPDSARVVYRLGQGSAASFHSVPIDGSSSPIPLSSLSGSFAGISPDGNRLLIATTGGLAGLWSVPLDGTAAAMRLTDALPPGSSLGPVQFHAASGRAVYSVGMSSLGQRLESVPVDGSVPADFLTGSAFLGTIGSEYAVDEASGEVAFRGANLLFGVTQAQAVPVDGSAPPRVLNGPFPTFPLVETVQAQRLAPRGDHVLYSTNRGLWSAPLRERGDPVRISPPELDATESVDLDVLLARAVFSQDGQRVFYWVRSGSSLHALCSSSVDGTSPPALLDTLALFPGLAATGPLLSEAEGSVLFGTVSGSEFGVSGSVLAHDLATGLRRSLGGGVLLGLGAGATRALTYDTFLGQTTYHSVPVSGGPGALFFSGPDLSGGGLRPVLDGERVLYGLFDAGTSETSLWSAPAEGGSPGIRIDDLAGAARFWVDPSDAEVAFARAVASLVELRIRAADGSGSSLTLATFPTFGLLESVDWTPTGDRLLLRGDLETDGVVELFSVPTNGSGPLTKVSFPLVPGGSVLHATLAVDGSRAIYLADGRVDAIPELFTSSLLGGAATMLHFPLPPGREIGADFVPLRRGSVLFRGQPNDFLTLVFHARLDGTGPYRRFSGAPAHPDVRVREGLAANPDQSWLVYLADELTPGIVELFGTPLNPPRSSSSLPTGPPRPFGPVK